MVGRDSYKVQAIVRFYLAPQKLKLDEHLFFTGFGNLGEFEVALGGGEPLVAGYLGKEDQINSIF